MASFLHKDRVDRCYDVVLGDVFDNITYQILKLEASQCSVPLEFMVPPLITAASHFLNKSEIQSWGSWIQPSIIYSATVGFTGTNKTAALDCIRDSITEVEQATGLSDFSSKINQSATVESLLKQLNNSDDSRQVQLWDELKTWQSSLGLYKSGAASEYDTTIYLTAYNGGTLKRQTCSSNILVRKPVLNICGMAHPGEICKVLDEERKNSYNNDGLYSRFLLSMPKPEFLDANADPNQTTDSDVANIARLFYALDQIHKTKKIYKYSNEALTEAVKFYNEQQEYLRANHSADTYISGVIGKLKGHAQRLAMVVQALDDASSLLHAIDENKRGPINDDLKYKIKEHLKENTNSTADISLDNTKRAIELSNYFLSHKKFLSGYNATGSVEQQSINHSNKLTNKILLHPGTSVPCGIITRNTRFTAEIVKQEMKNLTEAGFGKTVQEKPSGGGRMMLLFKKVNPEGMSPEEAVSFTAKLTSFGINYMDYIHSCENTENAMPLCKKPKLVDEN